MYNPDELTNILKLTTTTFKIWVHVEIINDDEDFYEDHPDLLASLGEFDNLEEAQEAFEDLIAI